MVGHRENQPANTRLLVRYIYGGSPRAFLRPENRRVNILSLCAGIRGKRKLTNVLSAWRRGPTENLCADLPKSRRRLAYLPRAAFRPNPEKTTDGRSCHIRLESLRAQILRPDWILLLTGFRRRAQFCTGSHSRPCFRRISQHRPGLPPQGKFRFLARGPAAQAHQAIYRTPAGKSRAQWRACAELQWLHPRAPPDRLVPIAFPWKEYPEESGRPRAASSCRLRAPGRM